MVSPAIPEAYATLSAWSNPSGAADPAAGGSGEGGEPWNLPSLLSGIWLYRAAADWALLLHPP